MTRTAKLLDTSSKRFAFLSKQVEAPALNSGTTRSQDEVVVKPMPSWQENLWPMPSNRLSAIVAQNSGLPNLPSGALTELLATGATVYIISVGVATTYLVIGTSSWQVLSDGAWVEILAPSSSELATVYVLAGNTYMLDSGAALYRFNPANPSTTPFSAIENISGLLDLSNTGIIVGEVLSSCAALNYRILVTSDTVFWSAPENNLMFDPQATGGDDGAGLAKVTGITTAIRFVVGTEDGFYIHTSRNTVRVVYTGNALKPWRFIVMKNSTGCVSRRHIVDQDSTSLTYLWSTTGFGILDKAEMSLKAPALTELLAGDVYEVYNSSAKRVQKVTAGARIDVQLYLAGKRYLCFSYGIEGVHKNYIIMHDLATGQWTKLNIPHIAVLDILQISEGGKLFDEWLENFEDSPETFASYINSDSAAQVLTNSIGILTTAGTIIRLSPVEIFTGTSGLDTDKYEVLRNVLVYPHLRLTRKTVYELNEIILHLGEPSYATLEASNSAVHTDTESITANTELASGTGLEFLLRDPNSQDIAEYVNVIAGADLSITLEDINSITGLEVVFKDGGRKWP